MLFSAEAQGQAETATGKGETTLAATATATAASTVAKFATAVCTKVFSGIYDLPRFISLMKWAGVA